MRGAVTILICAAAILLGEARISKKVHVVDEPDNTPINDDPRLASIICATEGSNGVLVAHEDCSKFYVCNNGRRVAMQCPPNLLYNAVKKQCDWASNVNCPVRIPGADLDIQGRVMPSVADEEVYSAEFEVVNDDYNLAPQICAGKGSNGVLVAHRYCNHFYKCNNGFPVALPCPNDLLYNPRKEQCDWPKYVVCGTRVMPEPDIGNDDDSADNDVPAADDDSDDDNVVINDDYNLAPVICAAEGSDGILVAHRFCNRFNKCANRVPVALRCQLNLLYNPRSEQCDWPENVVCGTRVIPDSEMGDDDDSVENDVPPADDESAEESVVHDDYNLAPVICAAEGSDGVLVAHRFCNQFNKCNNRAPVAFRCQLNLLYNPRLEQCDWPEKVVCGTRIIPSPEIGDDDDSADKDVPPADDESAEDPVINDDYTLAPVICAAEGSDGVLVAHRYCHLFNKCNHGRPVALSCQSNLLFNARTKQCDWPQNVDCNGRIL